MTSAPQKIYEKPFTCWETSVAELLEATGLEERLRDAPLLIVKPNLVEPQAPPVTTPVELVEAIISWCRTAAPHLEIVVAEGCGSLRHDTHQVFETLGYLAMARRQGVTLIDLNTAETVDLRNPACRRWPEMHLPALLFKGFLLSVPVLKAHSLAGVTLTMKNMMGAPPPVHYQQGGGWKKASFHQNIQEAVFDLNRYRAPDFTVLDATVGMSEAHLWGPHCEPPPNRLVAGADPVAVDAYGCRLLDRDWRRIGHIARAHGVLGVAEPLQVVNLPTGSNDGL